MTIKLSCLFFYLKLMWNMKEYYLNLSRTMSEDKIVAFWFELAKQDSNSFDWYNEASEVFN